jgi:hypothetical protein
MVVGCEHEFLECSNETKKGEKLPYVDIAGMFQGMRKDITEPSPKSD